MEVLDRIPVTLDFDTIAARVHVESNDEDAASLRALIGRAQEAARPKALFELGYLGPRGDDTLEINGVTFASRVLSVNLKDIHRVFAYVVTCGREFDQVATEGDPLQQYWLDQMRMVALGAAGSICRSTSRHATSPGSSRIRRRDR